MNSRKLLYLFAFLEGATVMVVELLGARMAAPSYGASLIAWTIILSVAVGGLALGYYAGGKLAARKDHKELLLRLLAFAALLVVLMPTLAVIAIQMFSSMHFWASLTLSVLVFFLPPVLCLGATTPLITRLLSAGSEAAGSVAGKVFGISTLGGIIATFAAGFYIIPSLGLISTSIITGSILGLVPCILLLRQRKLAIPALLVAAALISVIRLPGGGIQRNTEVLYRSEGLLGQLLVADVSRNDSANGIDRILFVNRMGQTWIDNRSGRSRWGYVDTIVSVLHDKQDPDVLLLGLGGGTVAKELEVKRNANVDAVEMDERIADIAKKYFGLSDRTKIIIDDARHYIRTAKKKYDVIVFDVFKGEVPPAHVLTLECFNEAKQLLKSGGRIIINFNGFVTGKEGVAGRSVHKTLLSAGFNVKCIPTAASEREGNMIYVGKLPPLLYCTEAQMPGAYVLRDDEPILEILNLPAAQRWREGYNSWTRSFTSEGIPVFE